MLPSPLLWHCRRDLARRGGLRGVRGWFCPFLLGESCCNRLGHRFQVLAHLVHRYFVDRTAGRAVRLKVTGRLAP